MNEKTTIYISVIAIVISLISLVWNIVRDLLLDVIKVKVTVMIGRMVPVQGMQNRVVFLGVSELNEEHRKSLQILFTATNAGRRPIVIEKVGGKYTKKHQKANQAARRFFILTTRQLPKKLEPYEAHSEYSDDASVLKELRDGVIKELFLVDSIGKHWKVQRGAIRKLRRDALLVR